MADDNKNPYNSFIAQLTGADWIAAVIGAFAGGLASASVLHLDGGTAVGAGAVAAVTARRTTVASFRGFGLKKKARALERVIEANIAKGPGFLRLREELERERTLWKSGATTSAQFDARLDSILEAFRKQFT